MGLLLLVETFEDIGNIRCASRVQDEEESGCGEVLLSEMRPELRTFASSTPSPYGGSVRMVFSAPAISPL